MSDTFTQLTLSLDQLLELAVHASWASPDEDIQLRFLQWMANELQYQYGMDREELTKAGFPEDSKDQMEESLEDVEEQVEEQS
jgi:hypothetical protein